MFILTIIIVLNKKTMFFFFMKKGLLSFSQLKNSFILWFFKKMINDNFDQLEQKILHTLLFLKD